MPFAFHGFQSWQLYSSKGMTRHFNSVSMRERFRDWNILNTHPILSLAFLTIYLIWIVKVAVLLIMMPWSLICSLSSMFESSYDFYVIADFISCSFSCRRSSKLNWHWTSYYLYISANLYSLCKSFYSICLSSSSFIARRMRVSSAQHDTVHVESAIS